MSHEPATAALVAAGFAVLAVLSGIGGRLFSAEISASVIATGVIAVVGILATVLGWIAVTVYAINGTTNAIGRDVTNTVQDITEIKARLDLLEHPERRALVDRVEALEHQA